MNELEKAAYITKFFDQRANETAYNIQASFSLATKIFRVEIWGHHYEWTIEQAQCFVIGWNARNNWKQ